MGDKEGSRRLVAKTMQPASKFKHSDMRNGRLFGPHIPHVGDDVGITVPQMVEASEDLEKIASSTKLNNAPAFLDFLFDLGRKTTDAWFARAGEAILAFI